MIGVSMKPRASSAERMARTRPSIMSLGATMSAPAAAWETAVRASSSTEASLRTWKWPSRPRSVTPQCPWLVYSHRHTSVMTSRSGSAAFRARTACCTMPSVVVSAAGLFVLVRGDAEKQHGAHPGFARGPGLGDEFGDGELRDARHGRDGLAPRDLLADEKRQDQVGGAHRRLADHLTQGRRGP